MAQGIAILVLLLCIAFAAGYFTRDYMSRKRRAEARQWKGYLEPNWPRPANTNQVVSGATGELGRMLGRWESRLRNRRSQSGNSQ